MEAFRRLGLRARVREAGPADYPPRRGHSHSQLLVSSSDASRSLSCRALHEGRPDTRWPTPPPHRVNQIFLEPVLLGAAAATPRRVRILNGMRVDAIEQREDQILATATESRGNATTTIAARYGQPRRLHSRNYRAIGAVLQGDAAVLCAQTSVIPASAFLAMMPGPAWAIDCINPRNRGSLSRSTGYAQRWIVHKFAVMPGATMSLDRERSVRDILGVGPSFSFETLSSRIGSSRMLADRFRDRRVFLCGDAAHIQSLPLYG